MTTQLYFLIINFQIPHKTANAQLSSEQRSTKATALRHKRKTHCKPKLPRVANLLKLFVRARSSNRTI